MKTKTLLFAGAVLTLGLFTSQINPQIVDKIAANSMFALESGSTVTGSDAPEQPELSEPKQESGQASSDSASNKYADASDDIVAAILPFGEQKKSFAMFLQDISGELKASGDINWRSIEFGKSKTFGRFGMLPVQASLEVNNVNFVGLLRIINSSGSLQKKDYFQAMPIRLMVIKSLDVKIPDFPADTDPKSMKYLIKIELLAFYRTKADIQKIDEKLISQLTQARTDFLRAMLDINRLVLAALDLTAEQNAEQKRVVFKRFYGVETLQGGIIGTAGILKNPDSDGLKMLQQIKDELLSFQHFSNLTHSTPTDPHAAEIPFELRSRYLQSSE